MAAEKVTYNEFMVQNEDEPIVWENTEQVPVKPVQPYVELEQEVPVLKAIDDHVLLTPHKDSLWKRVVNTATVSEVLKHNRLYAVATKKSTEGLFSRSCDPTRCSYCDQPGKKMVKACDGTDERTSERCSVHGVYYFKKKCWMRESDLILDYNLCVDCLQCWRTRISGW